MSNEAKLGTLPQGNEGKDAVHIAIIPAIAGMFLQCGMSVKMNRGGHAIECPEKDAIGIVDPFLKQNNACVVKGSWFWLCLYPKTITGLRHVWEHPSFPMTEVSPESKSTDNKLQSKLWLTDYVSRHCPYWEDYPDKGYSEFLRYVKDERWIYYNGSDCHSLSDVYEQDELFKHLSVVLECRIDSDYFTAFTCSC